LATAAATALRAKQLTVAESAVAQATSHLKLMRALVNQACAVANKATRCHAASHKTLATACCVRATAVATADVATADESQCVAELNALDMDAVATTKNQLALGAQALFKSATRTHEDTVNALNALRECRINVNTADNGGSIRTKRTMAMPRLTSTISTTPMVAMATVTPGLIFPGNDFMRAMSVLYAKTNAAIRDINTPTASKDVKMNAINLAAPTIGGRATIISTLRALLDDGILKPLLVFHAGIVNNAQDRLISKATVEPLLKQAAVHIAALVEAKHPVSRPTLKGLIRDDVDKTTEDLHRRVQSLR
jgi:hypothetical protein